MNTKIKNHLALALLWTSMFACGGDDEFEIRGDIAVGETCTETEECVPGSLCFNEFCVGEGELRISLSFFDDTDLDLHLLTPSGHEISFFNRDADGGTLDVDQCISTCGQDIAHAENIVFYAPPRGVYQVWVNNYDGRSAAAFDIEIDGEGISTTFQETLPAIAGQRTEFLTFEY